MCNYIEIEKKKLNKKQVKERIHRQPKHYWKHTSLPPVFILVRKKRKEGMS